MNNLRTEATEIYRLYQEAMALDNPPLSLMQQLYLKTTTIAITLAGGYAFNRDDTVDIHLGTVEECVKVFGGEEIEQGYRNIYSG